MTEEKEPGHSPVSMKCIGVKFAGSQAICSPDDIREIDSIDRIDAWPEPTDGGMLRQYCCRYIRSDKPAVTLSAFYTDGRATKVVLSIEQAEEVIRALKGAIDFESECERSLEQSRAYERDAAYKHTGTVSYSSVTETADAAHGNLKEE